MGCAHNNYLNLEKHSRTGMCNYCKDYLGRNQGVTNVKAPIKCLQCGVGLHEECYYTYHQLREGVVLDLLYEINLVRSSHKTLHKCNRKMCRFQQRRVKPDLHQGVEVPGQHSQDEREKGPGKIPQKKKLPKFLEVMTKYSNLLLYRCWLFVSCEGGKKKRIVHVWSMCMGPHDHEEGLILTPPVTRNS